MNRFLVLKGLALLALAVPLMLSFGCASEYCSKMNECGLLIDSEKACLNRVNESLSKAEEYGCATAYLILLDCLSDISCDLLQSGNHESCQTETSVMDACWPN